MLSFLLIDRQIDVISIASLMFLVTSRLADQRMKPVPVPPVDMPEQNLMVRVQAGDYAVAWALPAGSVRGQAVRRAGDARSRSGWPGLGR
jgi:hypothetical protein